jgi:group I intron endonuclease
MSKIEMVNFKTDKLEYIKDNPGIYIIWSKLNTNLVYVGSSNNLRRRYREHYLSLLSNKHHNRKLQRYCNKYGIENLGFCIHTNYDNISLEDLRLREKEIIIENDSFKNGFNLSEETTNPILSEEGRKILSDKAKERQSTPEVKEMLRIQNSGTKNPYSKLTEEDVKYIRENFKRISERKSNCKELAKKFNIDRRSILRVIKKDTYNNI